jgi:formyl-CoA transferase
LHAIKILDCEARLPRLRHIFNCNERWTMTKTKLEAMEILNTYDIPRGPVVSLKECAGL